MCCIDGCNKKVQARGFCWNHYKKFMKYGDPLYKHPKKEKKETTSIKNKGLSCSIPNCNLPAKCKGLCQGHYSKFRLENEERRAKHNEQVKKYHKSEKGKANLKKLQNNGNTKRASKKYYSTEKGKEAVKQRSHVYRARKMKAATEKISREEIFERDLWICKLCGKPVNKKLAYPNPLSASLDHIIPISRGGSHTINNVQLAHLRCNLRKNSKTPEEFSEYLTKQENQC